MQPTEELKDPVDREKALVALAEASASVKDIATFRETLQRGFDLGEEIFQEDLDAHPTKPAFFADGLQELSRLTQLGARVDPESTLQRVLDTQNQALQAYLTIEMADGIRAHRRETNETKSN